MQTPIADFVTEYARKEGARFHMPGHKGQSILGWEAYDITEVRGADELYLADGIIAESEGNATALFGTGRTVYSTEGSSQCIRAMLYLALTYAAGSRRNKGITTEERPYVVAARNVHKAFIYAAALLDLDVEWMWPKEMHSLCSCHLTTDQVIEALSRRSTPPIGVYLTSPDYLGGQAEVEAIAKVCHEKEVILMVDNAHGAYLHFLKHSTHPMDLGADLCCDSAHKTLPVLTGGAYLHVGTHAPESFKKNAKQAMALFGSTSPSYLTLMSLDKCNGILGMEGENNYALRLADRCDRITELKHRLFHAGWKVETSDPLKLTLQVPTVPGGKRLAEHLSQKSIECEYADDNYIVFMITPDNKEGELEWLESELKQVMEQWRGGETIYEELTSMAPVITEQVMTIREAMFASGETVAVEASLSCICGTPIVSCPPAIPIVVPGERVSEAVIAMAKKYRITEFEIVK